MDARYLRWIARLQEADGDGQQALNRGHLNELLQQSLQRASLRVALLRLYWYSESDDQAVCDDQTLRLLPSVDTDGSALVRQLSADLQALVASGRVDVVLLASDDDRLLPVMEAAKLAGVTVCALADERAQAMPRLMQQDPNWARLLREADRRLVIRSTDLAQALQSGDRQGFSTETPAEDLQVKLNPVVQAWWTDLTHDDQEGLKEELPGQRGLPPEVDRELLLRGKNVMGRALNFHEKRVLRLLAREAVLGPESPAADSP